jgi:MinD-like ATPase involved in chromosome partitioning or flagellar assembly
MGRRLAQGVGFMSKIISLHSFRGGTGKSNITANMATQMALSGKRIGVVDTDILSPGIHVLFGIEDEHMEHSLNDYLWGECDIEQTALDVTPGLKVPISGKLYLIPSSIKAGEIARVLREGYDVGLLSDGFRSLIASLDLDMLIIDTHPGINEETPAPRPAGLSRNGGHRGSGASIGCPQYASDRQQIPPAVPAR